MSVRRQRLLTSYLRIDEVQRLLRLFYFCVEEHD